jgi:hypothetical protein
MHIEVLYVDGQITAAQIPSAVEENQPATISVTLKNTGNRAGDFAVKLGDLSENVRVVAGATTKVDFQVKFDRYHTGDVKVCLFYGDSLLDTKTGRVSVLYPELSLTLKTESWKWVRGNNGLPAVELTIKCVIKNGGTGAARNVEVALYDVRYKELAQFAGHLYSSMNKSAKKLYAEFTETHSFRWPDTNDQENTDNIVVETAPILEKEISYISAGQEHRETFVINTSPVWEEIDGTRFLTKFEAQVELVAKYGGQKTKSSFSESIPRRWLEHDKRYAPYTSPYLVTPDDPVVKETLQELLNKKAPWDIRTSEVYLLDWVAGGITGFGVGEDVTTYNRSKLNTDAWFKKHDFWSQLPRETIQSRKGVCIDQAILFASFLRAYGYSPEDVYVVVGRLNPGDGGHAWVAFNRPGLLGKRWVLVETTRGGVMRVVNNVFETFTSIWDWIVSSLGHEDAQVYRELYRFNDVSFEDASGWNIFPW